MRFDFNTAIAGVRLIEFRNLLRRFERYPVDECANWLGISEAESAKLLSAAVDAGYLVKDQKASEEFQEDIYEATALGFRLRSAKALKRIPRKKAEEILAQIPATVEEINANPEFVYVIKRVLIFGSFLESAPDLGDIDTVVETAIKPEWEGRNVEANEMRARKSGRRLSFLDTLFFGEHEVTKAFKRISRYISLHQNHELEALKPDTWQAYPPEGVCAHQNSQKQ